MPHPEPSKVVKQVGRSRRKMKKDLKTLVGPHSQAKSLKFLEYERRTLMNSCRKRLDTLLQTAARGGLCNISAHNLRCLYSKNVPEEEKSGVLETLRPDARAIHEFFLREEEAQKDKELGIFAEIVARDNMMEEASWDNAETTGREGGDAEEGEEGADDDDMETDREDGGVALATDE